MQLLSSLALFAILASAQAIALPSTKTTASLVALKAAMLPVGHVSALRGGEGEGKLERTFAMIKPDAMAAGNDIHIKKHIRDAGFIIVAEKVVTLSKEKAEGFYAEHQGRPFFAGLVDFMTSGPVTMLILQKKGAILGWRSTMGPTNSLKARTDAKGSVRALYGTDGGKNAAHGSDSPKSAAREIRYMFGIIAWLKAVLPGYKVFWPKN